eukprot:1759551-Rhodomonas_salina.1
MALLLTLTRRLQSVNYIVQDACQELVVRNIPAPQSVLQGRTKRGRGRKELSLGKGSQSPT